MIRYRQWRSEWLMGNLNYEETGEKPSEVNPRKVMKCSTFC